jgi:hypothetical protein
MAKVASHVHQSPQQLAFDHLDSTASLQEIRSLPWIQASTLHLSSNLEVGTIIKICKVANHQSRLLISHRRFNNQQAAELVWDLKEATPNADIQHSPHPLRLPKETKKGLPSSHDLSFVSSD